jgi:hypothetical protein
MTMTNSLLFVAFVLGSGTLVLAQGQASPKVLNVSGTTVLSTIDTAGGMRADQVFALLSDSAAYLDPSVSEADPPAEPAVLSDFCNEAPLNDTSSCSANRGDPPAESADPPNPCRKASTTDADYGMPDGF